MSFGLCRFNIVNDLFVLFVCLTLPNIAQKTLHWIEDRSVERQRRYVLVDTVNIVLKWRKQIFRFFEGLIFVSNYSQFDYWSLRSLVHTLSILSILRIVSSFGFILSVLHLLLSHSFNFVSINPIVVVNSNKSKINTVLLCISIHCCWSNEFMRFGIFVRYSIGLNGLFIFIYSCMPSPVLNERCLLFECGSQPNLSFLSFFRKALKSHFNYYDKRASITILLQHLFPYSKW